MALEVSLQDRSNERKEREGGDVEFLGSDAGSWRTANLVRSPLRMPHAGEYKYSPLPADRIRLLRLVPNEDGDGPLRCKLFEYPLFRSRRGGHMYEALSYVWGSSIKSEAIFTDEGSLSVTPNLHLALLRLRDPMLERVVWVDSVCINQDATEERNRQVQSMAEIYAKASRVLVWLEEATLSSGQMSGSVLDDTGDRALEEIRTAALAPPLKGIADSEPGRRAVFRLLQRSWFRRIWVLQEVAAARQVLVMSRSAELDGYAFWLGLKALKLTSGSIETRAQIQRAMSAINLIKDAICRPKTAASSRPDRYSLGIRPLAELIDLYHDRDASDRRDKVYALLGMSSDNPAANGLSANYEIPWQTLFPRLVQSIIGEQSSVATGESEEIAVIEAKCAILGLVGTPWDIDGQSNTWGDEQRVRVIPRSLTEDYVGNGKWHNNSFIWTLQATTSPIQEGDIVCLLEGASKPTIVRFYGHCCVILAIAATLPDDAMPANETASERKHLAVLLDSFRSMTEFPHDLVLLWDWGTSMERPDGSPSYQSLIDSQMLKLIGPTWQSSLDQAARSQRAGLLLGELGMSHEAAEHLGNAVAIYEKELGNEHPHTLAARGHLSVMSRVCDAESVTMDLWSVRASLWETLSDIFWRRGDFAQISEDKTIHVIKCLSSKTLEFLLDERGDEVQITDRIVAAAAAAGPKTMKVLLSQRGDEVQITEAVVRIAVQYGPLMMELLFERKGDEVPITDAVLERAAGVEEYGYQVMKLLLKRKGDQARITRRMVEAADGNKKRGKKVMQLLLEWRGVGSIERSTSYKEYVHLQTKKDLRTQLLAYAEK